MRFFIALFISFISLNVVLAQGDSLEQDKISLSQAENEIHKNNLEKAKQLIKNSPKNSNFGLVYGAFLSGRIAEKENKLRDARDIYRKILNASPNLARARFHLAEVLKKLGDTEGAKHNFEMVAGGEIDKNLSEKIKTEIKDIALSKRWHAQSHFSIVPTSNMSQGTFREKVLITGIAFTPDPATKQKSGIGLIYGLEANYLYPIKDDIRMLFSFATQHSDFSHNTFDDRTLRAGFGPQFFTTNSVTSLEAYTLHRRIGAFERGYSTAFGGQISSRHVLTQKDRITGVVAAQTQNYDIVKYQEGYKINSALTYDRFLSSSSYISSTIFMENEKTRNQHLNYRQIGGTIGYHFETPGALIFYPNISLIHQAYEGVFPLTDIKRTDIKEVYSLTFTKKNWLLFGLAPKTTISYINNTSNIELYDYKKLDIFMNFTKVF